MAKSQLTIHQQRQPAIPAVKLRGLALLLVQRAGAATRYAKLGQPGIRAPRRRNKKRNVKMHFEDSALWKDWYKSR
jgi:hypothetical protein